MAAAAPGLAAGHDRETEPLLSSNFVLVCLSSLCHFFSFSLLTAALPIWALGRGATDWEIGLLVTLVAFPALVSRAVSGWLVDRHGAKPFIVFGSFIYATASLLYGWTPSLVALLALRAYHGLGLGIYHTASSVFVADIAPRARRGEAIGYFGMMQTGAQAAAPALGVSLAEWLGYEALWLTCAGLAAVACLFGLRLRERRERATAPLRWGAFFAPGALAPSLACLGLFVGTSTVISFVAVYAVERGIANPGLYYLVQALATVLARGAAGKLSDRFGRLAVIAPSLVLTTLGLAALSLAESFLLFAVAGVLIGVGSGCAFPALIAQAIDRVPASERGAAMSTFGIGQELGIGGGSLGMAIVASLHGYPAMFLAAGVAPLVGLALALATLHSARPPRPTSVAAP